MGKTFRDGKHPSPCNSCGGLTYRYEGICKACAPPALTKAHIRPSERGSLPAKMIPRYTGKPGRRRHYEDPTQLPADYLALCAAELAKRQNERDAQIASLMADLRAEAA